MIEFIMNSIDGFCGKLDDIVFNNVFIDVVMLYRLLGLCEYGVLIKFN